MVLNIGRSDIYQQYHTRFWSTEYDI